MAHLFIAAAHKSSGKTTISVGLAGALVRRGMVVQPFKKGPDYIDPMWLSRAASRPCYNLDFNTMSHGEIAELFASRCAGADIGLIESNKGLFDGLDLEGADSNAALSKLLRSPVVLVIDVTGMTRGIAPLLIGYQQFDPDISIAGVILNKVGGARHEEKLRAAVARYTDLAVLGALGRDDKLTIDERHLGLTTPQDIAALDERLQRLYSRLEEEVDVERLLEIAKTGVIPAPVAQSRSTSNSRPVRIGIARDDAFCYYYPDDLEALQFAGAELVFFDTLKDAQVPDIDGLFIGGGFPETHMQALEANQPMRQSINQALGGGMPAYAECGGLMYLCNSLVWQGRQCQMVGAVDGDAVMCERPQGRGYTRLATTANHPWMSTTAEPANIAAHEFHFARIDNLPDNTKFAWRMQRGHGIDGSFDGIVLGNLLAGFGHLRDTSNHHWAKQFVAHVRSCSQ